MFAVISLLLVFLFVQLMTLYRKLGKCINFYITQTVVSDRIWYSTTINLYVNRKLIPDTPRNSCGCRTANLQLSAPSGTLIQFVKAAEMDQYLLITRCYSHVENLRVDRFK
jgi:hypothetical protein